eukprot:TRINITY_DN295_c0_g1_i1.p1 TRINITY_DN295_c0_g1~~TRINITY_DN295_c0_g1_i1.p1  ORF type:complete len:214 (-),score=80.96 TRINITY_DN295_c0_g1_i1:28-669(-)
MADKFPNLDSQRGVGKLNGHLNNKSYIEGYTPTQEDVKVFEQLTVDIPPKMKNVVRWHAHIASFTDEEKAAFGSEAPIAVAVADEGEDDEFDFFADEDSADEAAAAELKAKLEEEKANKKKAGPVERSAIIMAVKPADVDVDMDELEAFTRAIEMEGLEWKASEFQDVAFGIQKLIISCHIIDDLVSMDTIEQILEDNEDLVSSTEILSFSKL